MAPPLTLPVTPADLRALIAAAWPGCAEARGVRDVADTQARADASGHLYATATHLRNAPSVMGAALDELANALEEHGLVIDWQGSVRRVVGWAAYRCGTVCAPRRIRGTTMVAEMEHDVLRRLCDLPPSDPRRRAHEDAVLAARLARNAEGQRGKPPNAKLEHARAVHRMAYPRGGR